MADTPESGKPITGSGLDPEAGKDGNLTPTPNSPPTAQPNQDPVSPDPAVAVTAERDKLANELATTQTAQAEQDKKFKDVVTRLEAAEGKLKDKEREGLSEVDKYKEILKDQNEKITELVDQNQQQMKQTQEQQWQNEKQMALASSGLRSDLWQYAFGNTREELEASISGLKNKVETIQSEALKQVPPSVTTENVGNPAASNFQNEGLNPEGQPGSSEISTKYNQKAVELVKEKATNVMDVQGIIEGDPVLRNLLTGGRK